MSDGPERIGGCDPEFLGDPQDEEIAGEIYNDLPRFEAGNQVNRKEAVKVIADAIRSIVAETADVLEIGVKLLRGEQLSEAEEGVLTEAYEVATEFKKQEAEDERG